MTKKAKASINKVSKKSVAQKMVSSDFKVLFQKNSGKKFEFSKASKRTFTKSVIANMNVG